MVTKSANGDFTWRKNMRMSGETELKYLNHEGAKRQGNSADRKMSESFCWKCLAGTPCVSLLTWILMFMGLTGWTVTLLFAVFKTRTLIEMDGFLSFTEYAVMGITISTFILCTIFLIVAALSSGENSRHIFMTTRRNGVGRAFNILMLVLGYTCKVVWILLSSLMTIPLIAIALFHLLYNEQKINEIDLKHYGYGTSKVLADEQLAVFWTRLKDVGIFYLTAYISAFIVMLSLLHFLIAIGANYKHLKETRLTTFNAYKHSEVRGSTGSILDTKM